MSNLKIENIQKNTVLDREALTMIDGGWGIPGIIKNAARRVYSAGKKITCFPRWPFPHPRRPYPRPPFPFPFPRR